MTQMAHLFRCSFYCVLCIVFCILSCAACQQQAPTAGGGQKKRGKDLEHAVVAEFAGSKITVKELQMYVDQSKPAEREELATPEAKQQFLKKIISQRVLGREARRQGMHKLPHVERAIDRLLVDVLMRKKHDEFKELIKVSEKELRDYYDKNLSLYQIPPKVRASQVVTQTRAEADRVLALARKKPGDLQAFKELVQKFSIDVPSKKQQGDLGFFTNTDEKISQNVIREAFYIKRLYGLAGPVKTADGFAVLMKTGETMAVNQGYEQERERIRSRLEREKLQQSFRAFIDDLKAKAKITIYKEKLDKIEVRPPKH